MAMTIIDLLADEATVGKEIANKYHRFLQETFLETWDRFGEL
jgi:hypothetical protein